MKTCNECNKEKSLEEFRKVNGYYRNTCKKCLNEQRRIKNGTVKRKFPNGFLDTRISGLRPAFGEISIYVLYNGAGEVFYVGQTTNPIERVGEHIKTFNDSELTLAILKNVNPDQAVYWEAKTLVDYTDAGYTLVNTQTPKTGKKRKGWLCPT